MVQGWMTWEEAKAWKDCLDVENVKGCCWEGPRVYESFGC